jgi:hypothetical protein
VLKAGNAAVNLGTPEEPGMKTIEDTEDRKEKFKVLLRRKKPLCEKQIAILSSVQH